MGARAGRSAASGMAFADRSRVVSFDRPYDFGFGGGAADLIGNELPLVSLAERLGLDVTYSTDVDLHAAPERLLQHRALISLGHDEYWSSAMRQGVETARDHGVNLLFLGANAIYRQAMSYKDKGWMGTDYIDNQRRAELLLQQILTMYPESNKIGEVAYQLGDLYESKAYRQYYRAVEYFHRCYQWNPKTTLDARMRAYFDSSEAAADGDRFRIWLQQHSAELLGRVDDPTYGLMEIYRVRR